MKHSTYILAFAFILTLAASASAQRVFTGKVLEVIDGRTFVIDAAGGKMAGTLQYIEVPEPEQPLNVVIREHLQKLLMGKTVEFVPSGFNQKNAVGKAYVNGVDVGQQMVRDGAAWHLPIERSGQEAAESEVYDKNQAMAKSEKRGIWSIANLTPAWEFREQQGRAFQSAGPVDNSGTGKIETRNYSSAAADADMWIDVGGTVLAQKNALGTLFYGYDPEKKIRNVSTPSIAQTLAAKDRSLEVEMRVVYFQGELQSRIPNAAFVLGMLATSQRHNFEKENTLKFVADGREIVLDNGQRFWREGSASVQELIQYRIARSDLTSVANAKNLVLKIGNFNGTVKAESRETLLKLIQASN